ncbi:MAG: response regulator [Acidobacteriota bacterium]
MSTKKILLVDDDQDLLRGMAISLKAGGYDVVSARDAISAVSTARSAEPDLIVLDIGLSGGDGFLVMERLNDLLTLVPVIVVSATELGPNRQRALEAGAQAFFPRPVDRTAFMAAVRQALESPVPAE